MQSNPQSNRSMLNELRRRFALAFYGDSSHPITGHTEEDIRIDFLLEVISDYLIGVYDTAEVVEIFRRHPVPRFDILHWIDQKKAEGVLGDEYEVE